MSETCSTRKSSHPAPANEDATVAARRAHNVDDYWGQSSSALHLSPAVRVKQSNYSVLLVEDHHAIAVALGEYLEGIGYTVDYAQDGLVGLKLARSNGYDAIILDVGLPKLDGLFVCRQLRSGSNHSTPILMLSARDTLDDRLSGMLAGSDDYLTKPFEPAELAARLRAMIRRAKGDLGNEIYRIADLTLDTGSMTAIRAGQQLDLTPTGLRLLQILMRASPAVVSKRDMSRELWGAELPDSDALRSHLYNLRTVMDKPFNSPLLHMVINNGYRIASL